VCFLFVFMFMLEGCVVTLKCSCSSINRRGDAVNYHSDLGNSEGGTIASDEDVSILVLCFLMFSIPFFLLFFLVFVFGNHNI
jgi:hypothetical protein